jgi:hypothetical protein
MITVVLTELERILVRKLNVYKLEGLVYDPYPLQSPPVFLFEVCQP